MVVICLSLQLLREHSLSAILIYQMHCSSGTFGSKFSDSESFLLVVYYTNQAHPYSRPSVGMAIHSEVWKSDQE